MPRRLQKLSALIFACLIMPLAVQAQPREAGASNGQTGRPAAPPDYFSLGIAAGMGRPEFVDSNIVVNPFPFIGFRQGRFYSNQAGIGYEMYKNKGFRISALAEAGVQELNRNMVDSLDDMEGLDLPVYAGLSVDVPISRFVLTGTVQREVGLASDGWRAIGSISRPFMVNRKLFLTPSVSLQWSDDNVTNYIYGVSAEEAFANRPVYEADDSFKATGSLTGIYRLSDKFTLVGSTGLTWHNDEIVDSPIVDQRVIFSTFLAIGYNF